MLVIFYSRIVFLSASTYFIGLVSLTYADFLQLEKGGEGESSEQKTGISM
jgi:hypothetical protein